MFKGTVAYRATQLTDLRWMCGVCAYAYVLAGLDRCPKCSSVICTDAEDVLRYHHALLNIPQIDLTKMLPDVAFKYIELNYEKLENMTLNKPKQQVYSIRIESPFILTQRQIKEKLGIGFKVVSVETEKDLSTKPIIDVDSALAALIQTGYRALARANHPDLSASDDTESISDKEARAERMMLINRAKKEINELLDSLR